MPDFLKKVVTVYDDDGQSPARVQREYKTVHFEGEGAPRDVEITAEERVELYQSAHAVSGALITEAQTAQRDAENERDDWRAKAEQYAAERDEAQKQATVAERALAELAAKHETLRRQLAALLQPA